MGRERTYVHRKKRRESPSLWNCPTATMMITRNEERLRVTCDEGRSKTLLFCYGFISQMWVRNPFMTLRRPFRCANGEGVCGSFCTMTKNRSMYDAPSQVISRGIYRTVFQDMSLYIDIDIFRFRYHLLSLT
jgi:hypothetical protein